MIQGQDIICISNTTWFGEYTKSTVQIMSRLARYNRILFIEYPFTYKDIFNTFLNKQNAPVKRMLGVNHYLQKVETDQKNEIFHLVPPAMLPVDFIKNDSIFKYFFKYNIKKYSRRINKVIRELNFNNTIVITAYNPVFGLPLISKLREKLNVYYCYDGIGTRRHGKRIFSIDESFSRKTDAIITTSDFLRSEKLKFNSNTFVVKNGVDFKNFSNYSKKIVHDRRVKIVGYIGSLDHRFDIDLMDKTINKLHNFEFHFTGNLRNFKIMDVLSKYKNVRFFDSIQPNNVPKLLQSYDIGIIPYLVNDINKNIYPLKINEYMAVGVPIVMTPFADLNDFNNYVSVANNAEDFTIAIVNETMSDSSQKIHQRIEFARLNSWDNKTEEFGEILKNLINYENNQ
jgi:teichuronic acid biosynthesis glycosyltransferase TuaH